MTGWVYRITRKTDNHLIYIGSTFGQYFCMRGHTKPSAQSKHQNLYGYISENGGWDNFQIQIVSEYETLEDTRNEEKRLILELQPTCNVQHKKTKEQKQHQRNQWQKEYFAKNPEQKAKARDRNKANDILRQEIHIECPCGGKYTAQNKTNHFKRNIHKQYEANKSNQIGQAREEMESSL